MTERNYKLYVKAAFAPLVEISGRADLTERLYTKDLAEDRKELAYYRFKSLKYRENDIVMMSNGSYIVRIFTDVDEFIVISVANISEDEKAQLDRKLAEALCDAVELDEGTFLFLSCELAGVLRLSDRYRSRESALDFIDITAKEYEGHDINDLCKCYVPLLLFKLSADSLFKKRPLTSVALMCLSAAESMRSPLVDRDTASKILGLSGLPSIADEDLVDALTATSLRHSYLALYRCIERNYYYPWAIELAGRMESKKPPAEIIRIAQEILQWRYREIDSIEKIFQTTSNSELSRIEDSIDVIKNALASPDAKRAAIGKIIYKIRNALVHFEDRQDPNFILPRSAEMLKIVGYLATFLEVFCPSMSTAWAGVDE